MLTLGHTRRHDYKSPYLYAYTPVSTLTHLQTCMQACVHVLIPRCPRVGINTPTRPHTYMQHVCSPARLHTFSVHAPTRPRALCTSIPPIPTRGYHAARPNAFTARCFDTSISPCVRLAIHAYASAHLHTSYVQIPTRPTSSPYLRLHTYTWVYMHTCLHESMSPQPHVGVHTTHVCVSASLHASMAPCLHAYIDTFMCPHTLHTSRVNRDYRVVCSDKNTGEDLFVFTTPGDKMLKMKMENP
jgi:hypothetical protein